MATPKSELGEQGERFACTYLQKKDHVILHRNWKYGRKEIDIITYKDRKIIFVEVKTRSNDYFGEPEDAVNRSKQRLMLEAAEAYIHRYQHEGEVRFDIVSIIFLEKEQRIKHIKDAFFFYDE